MKINLNSEHFTQKNLIFHIIAFYFISHIDSYHFLYEIIYLLQFERKEMLKFRILNSNSFNRRLINNKFQNFPYDKYQFIVNSYL